MTAELIAPIHDAQDHARSLPAGRVAVVIGAVAWTAGQALLPDLGRSFDERVVAVAASRGLQQLATVLLFVAGVSFVVAATSLRTRATSAVRARLAAVGAVALGLGGVWLTAGRAAFNLQLLKATSDGVDPAAGLAVLEGSEGFGFAPFPLTLVALLVAPVLLALAHGTGWRTRWLPVALWVAGIGTFLAGEFASKPLEIVGIATATAGLVVATWGARTR
jgi:hypothetical protein